MSQSNTFKLRKSSKIQLLGNCLSGSIGVGIGIVIASFLGWI